MRPQPVILSYGMGVDSTAVLTRWLREPACRDFPLAALTVVTAMTGDEWDATGRHVERHVLPMLAAQQVRYVQVARHGPSSRDGITWLADSRHPQRLHLDGDYPLSAELRLAGTVPQSAHGRRLCSAKQKGAVLDGAIGRLTGGRPFRHALGFATGEERRAARDGTYNTAVRQGEYPLIAWGWTRQDATDYLHRVFGVRWPRSACVFCPFAVHRRADLNEEVFARYLADPHEAVRTLLIEYGSRCLNPRQTLLADRALLDVLAADGRFTDILRRYARARDDATRALVELRRVHRPGTPAMRSTRQHATGTRAAMATALAELARRHQRSIRDDGVTARVDLHARDQQPDVEHALVVAPGWIASKQRPHFETAWAAATRRVTQLDLFGPA